MGTPTPLKTHLTVIAKSATAPKATTQSRSITTIKRALPKEIFDEGINILTGIYPNFTKKPERFKPIQDLLSDLTPDQYMRGIRLFCLYHTEVYSSEGGAFTNLVALIRKYAFEDPNEKTPMEVWGDVVTACKKNEKDPPIADPVAKRIAAGIGFTTIKWEAIDGSDLNGFNRAHFMRAYEQARARRKMNLIAGFETEEKKLCEPS